MFITDLVSQARTSLAKRRQYHSLVEEIGRLSDRDIADFNGDRGEMLYHAYRKVYG